MAIKRVAILMQIDTGDKENPSATTRADVLENGIQVEGADETYMIYVNDSHSPGRPGKPNKQAMLNSAAHELGHVLSSAFKVSGGMHEDPRTMREFVGMGSLHEIRVRSTDEQKKRIHSNETLAWELAKKIRPEITDKQAQESLDTYKWAKTA